MSHIECGSFKLTYLELVYQSTVYFWEVVVDGGSLAVRLKNRTS